MKNTAEIVSQPWGKTSAKYMTGSMNSSLLWGLITGTFVITQVESKKSD
ncbi:MAG: hypothetical protein WC824_10905 [Bacteroidota bacterium]